MSRVYQHLKRGGKNSLLFSVLHGEYNEGVEHFEFVKINEIVNQIGNLLSLGRLQKIRSSIQVYLESAQSRVEYRFDSKLRRVLKEAYDLLEGVKVEIESIQGNILKLMKPVKRKVKPRAGKKPSPKKSPARALVAKAALRSKTTRRSPARA
jgi:hypothetical protein